MPPITRIEVFEFTIPAEVSEETTDTMQVEFAPGTVVKWTLSIPDGPSGLVGVRIAAFGTALVPNTSGRWIVANDEVIASEPANWPNSGHLELVGYNEDTYAHTVVLRLELTENVPPKALASPAGAPLALNPAGEIETSQGAGILGEAGSGLSPSPEAEPPTVPTGEDTVPVGGSAPGETPEEPAPAEPPEAPAPLPEVPEETPLEVALPSISAEAEVALPAEPELPAVPEGEGEPLIAGESEQPRTPAGAVSSHPKTKYHTVSRVVATKPATGLQSVASAIPGHPEVHMGAAVAVNLILRAWPNLVITSTTGGHHAPDSLHYRGEAVDLASGDTAYMNEVGKWVGAHLTKYLTEGIHNPTLSVKDGKAVSSSYWGSATWAEHLNHIHIGVAPPQEQELIAANRPGKKTVKERKATNPAKRKRAAGGKGSKHTPAKRKTAKHTKRKTAKRKTAAHAAKRKTTKRVAPKHAKRKTVKRKGSSAAKRKAAAASKRKAAAASKKAAAARKAAAAKKAKPPPRRTPAPKPKRRR